MSRIAVWMPVHKRHSVLKIAMEGLKDFSQRMRVKGHDVFLVVAWSNPDDLFQVVKHYGYPYDSVFKKNEPLSSKQNTLLEHMRGKFDYYLQLGSDDVILPSGDKYLLNAIDKGAEYIGARSVYFIEPSSKRAVSVKLAEAAANTCFGAGRLWSNEAMEKVFQNGSIWPHDANNALDYMSEQSFVSAGVKIRNYREDKPFVVDVKSDVNIWGFQKYKNDKAEDYQEIVRTIPMRARKAVNLLE